MLTLTSRSVLRNRCILAAQIYDKQFARPSPPLQSGSESETMVNSLINAPLLNNSYAERRVYLEVKNYFPGQVAHKQRGAL